MNSLMALQGLQMGQNLLMQSINGGMPGIMGTSMPMANMGMGMPMDIANFSSDINEGYGNSFNPFMSIGSQYPMGYNGGMGMVPGFGGMMGMQMMMQQQQQMQQMMQMLMMMLMMMMIQMQQHGCPNQMGNHGGASASASASGNGASASASVGGYGGHHYGNYGGQNPINMGNTTPSASGNAAVDLAEKYLGRDSIGMKGDLPNFTAAGGVTNNCADFVSSVLESTGRLKGHEINVRHLEQSLQKQGYQQVPREKAQPGDVWISDSAGHTELVSEAGGKALIGSNGSSRQKVSEDRYSGMHGGRFYHKFT